MIHRVHTARSPASSQQRAGISESIGRAGRPVLEKGCLTHTAAAAGRTRTPTPTPHGLWRMRAGGRVASSAALYLVCAEQLKSNGQCSVILARDGRRAGLRKASPMIGQRRHLTKASPTPAAASHSHACSAAVRDGAWRGTHTCGLRQGQPRKSSRMCSSQVGDCWAATRHALPHPSPPCQFISAPPPPPHTKRRRTAPLTPHQRQ